MRLPNRRIPAIFAGAMRPATGAFERVWPWLRSGSLHPYRGAGEPARSPCQRAETAGFAGQTSVAIGLLPAIVRADFVARHTVAAPARRADKSTANRKH